MKHGIIIGMLIAWGGLFAWAGGCEITGAGIGLHDVEEGGECVDSDDCKKGSCYEERCKSTPDGGACSEFNCSADGDCCTGNCIQGYCSSECGTEYSSCDFDDDCCSGYSCLDGSCESGPGCETDGSFCIDDFDCCSGTCDDYDGCVPAGSCKPDSDFCYTDDECCSHYCSTVSEQCL